MGTDCIFRPSAVEVKGKPGRGTLFTLLLASLVSLPGLAFGQAQTDTKTVPVDTDPYSAAQPDDGFIYDASLRGRYNFVDWHAGAPGTDNTFNFAEHKLQLGAGYKFEGIKAYVQGQYSQYYDVPNDAVGTFSEIYANGGGKRDPGDLFIRQAYLEFKNPPFSWGTTARVGRYLYNSGMEVMDTGNQDVDYLKRNRIGERLIGSSDFFQGRSYDGLGFDYKFDRCIGTLSVNALHPTQGVLNTDNFVTLRDIDLITAAYTTDIKGWPGQGEFQAFYYHYDDERNPQEENVFKVDNRPAALNSSDLENVQIQTFGFHWVQVYDVAESIKADTLLWGALQGGRWGVQDHLAEAWAIEAGLKFEEVVTQPWIRGGWNHGSGDDDPNDGNHHTFFQMLPSNRNYAMTPVYNMMNNEDVFAQLIMHPVDNVRFLTNAHYLWLAEKQDLLYSGPGAMQRRDRFGFQGLNSGGSNEIGTLLDFQLAADITENVTVAGYYGILFAGDALKNNFGSSSSNSDVSYAFAEVTLKL